MLRNWYAVYTLPQKEKNVASIFQRKGFDYLFPVITVVKGKSSNKKVISAPLFSSHVFVYLAESDISAVKNIPGVINFLYWKSKPAIIRAEEIKAIKHFIANYVNIKLVKSVVNMHEPILIKDEPAISYNENAVLVRYQTVKISLASLGYVMIADRGIPAEEVNTEEAGIFRSFPKKLNALFFN